MHDPHEQVHNPALDVWPQSHKLAVHSVKNRLEIVTLTWILTVKQLNEAVDKVIANMFDDLVILQMEGQNELQQ